MPPWGGGDEGGTGGGGFTYPDETPTGLVNGANVTFDLAHAPTGAQLQLFLNGQLLTVGTDYTLAGDVITMTNAPQAGGILRAFYS